MHHVATICLLHVNYRLPVEVTFNAATMAGRHGVGGTVYRKMHAEMEGGCETMSCALLSRISTVPWLDLPARTEFQVIHSQC